VRHFVCAGLGIVCRVLEEKNESFENVSKQLEKIVYKILFFCNLMLWMLFSIFLCSVS